MTHHRHLPEGTRLEMQRQADAARLHAEAETCQVCIAEGRECGFCFADRMNRERRQRERFTDLANQRRVIGLRCKTKRLVRLGLEILGLIATVAIIWAILCLPLP